ncbi:hypothetical protein ABD81_18880 [Bacillus thuringiensis]|uniref:hypothetical protein n=1 Tax=Bacillus thuringiensis TaxID=1428 RepID=UPI000A37F723|nr:hypothetical protein [Bacillus thuringiensis]MBG9750809.1 hypothetical protein [Bacillus thuringiensis]MBG9779795.1 hypothetical protein [Bacillus thuringiensis]MBG9929289.1 hypothetical protein [Bacillus thuringiensis]OTZ84586.1 hypothetical protein BK771_20510 [Bacillus thuringiensis serovar ostriniae]
MKQGIVGLIIVVLVGISVWLWNQNRTLQYKVEQTEKKWTEQVKELKTENRALEKRVTVLTENTQDKGQEVAKQFVELLIQNDNKQKEKPGFEKIKEMITGEARNKLLNAPGDAHNHIEDDGSMHIHTKAKITDMYYIKIADNKADVTVKYDYLVTVDGTEQQEKHTMKLNLVLEGEKWFVENYEFQINTGIEGP